MNTILRAENLTCSRALRDEGRSLVKGVNLVIEARSFSVVQGPVGSGRNLLLRLLGLLETPDAGEIFLRGTPTRGLDERTRAGIRNQHFGFMFAEPFLLPSLSVIENIAMPLLKNSTASTEEARRRTLALLEFVGLPDARETSVDQLSRTAQHRVSLARALISRPEILIAANLDDDPDSAEASELCALLRNAVNEFGVTVIFSAADAKTNGVRQIEMSAGMIARDSSVLANG